MISFLSGGSCAPTYFDTSQVDGYTLPYRVLITGNSHNFFFSLLFLLDYILKISFKGNTKCDCDTSGCTNLTLVDGSQLDVRQCPNNEDISTSMIF